MRREIEIDLVDGVVVAALLEDGEPVDLLPEPDRAPGLTGAVFLGRVARVDRRAGLAFVEIGTGRQAALALPAGESAVREGAALIVQANGEPREDKGPPVSLDLALAGRFLLRTPRRTGLSLSKRLAKETRQALSEALSDRVGEGWTVRTAATDAPPDLVLEEAARLDAAWRRVEEAALSAAPPELLHPAQGVALRAVLDRPDAATIRVGDAGVHKALRDRLRALAPDRLDRLTQEPTDIADRLPGLLVPELVLPGGGMMAIEPTRALVAVDVNAGAARDAAAANLEAAAALPRQLRLRNLGGLIVVDFVAAGRQGRARALKRLAEGIAGDPAQVRISERFTALGLAELTRQRRGFSLAEAYAAAGEPRPAAGRP